MKLQPIDMLWNASEVLPGNIYPAKALFLHIVHFAGIGVRTNFSLQLLLFLYNSFIG